MIRHFNSTGRKRIDASHVSVRILPAEAGETHSFEIDVDLADYQFDPGAQIRLEAWRKLASQRWQLGTVGEPSVPTESERRLTDVGQSAQFKLVVVASDGSGRLLGMSTDIQPLLPRQSLLPLVLQELGDEVWRVNFGDGDPPQLEVNRDIDMISEVVRSDTQFRSLVMPQVLRSILTQIIVVDRNTLDDDEGGWWVSWLRLAQSLTPTATMPLLARGEGDEYQLREAQTWIDTVVQAFSLQPVNAADAYAISLGVSR